MITLRKSYQYKTASHRCYVIMLWSHYDLLSIVIACTLILRGKKRHNDRINRTKYSKTRSFSLKLVVLISWVLSGVHRPELAQCAIIMPVVDNELFSSNPAPPAPPPMAAGRRFRQLLEKNLEQYGDSQWMVSSAPQSFWKSN